MSVACIFHPENLTPQKRYKICFKGALVDADGQQSHYSVLAKFISLTVGKSEMQNETQTRLQLAVKVGDDPYLRRISWSRITQIVLHDV